jgi:hypothetical protein
MSLDSDLGSCCDDLLHRQAVMLAQGHEEGQRNRIVKPVRAAELQGVSTATQPRNDKRTYACRHALRLQALGSFAANGTYELIGCSLARLAQNQKIENHFAQLRKYTRIDTGEHNQPLMKVKSDHAFAVTEFAITRAQTCPSKTCDECVELR